jgi:hypothetical protein
MKSNQFKTTTPLKVIRDNQDIEDIIGRPAHEHLKRVVPKFNESEDVRLTFHNPFIKFCHSIFRVDNNR